MTAVRVIGSGLSGLATAWYLAEAGARVHVFEAEPTPGGLIQTQHAPEGLIENAARAFTWSEPVASLFDAVGLRPCFAEPQSRRRYVFREGRPRRWPLTPLETVGAAARFGSAWLGRHVRPRDDETVASWGRRVLGGPATSWLIAPALQGIYASPPEVLSAAAIFRPGRRIRGKLVAPLAGMGALLDALHQKLVARGVTFEFGASVDRLDPSARTAICTAAPAASRLLTRQAPGLAAAIARIRMVSLVPVTAFFPPREHDLRGFGVLFPRSGAVHALGVLFNAEIFPGRSALRSETWIYGDLSPDALPRSTAAVGSRLTADRLALTGRSESPLAVYASPTPALLPVYDSRVLQAQAALGELRPRVGITGNYLGRLGVSGLVEAAAETAKRLSV